MSETNGTLVIKTSDKIVKELTANEGVVSVDLIGQLMEYSGLSAVISKGMQYIVSSSKLKGGYVEFQIESDSWQLISRPLVKSGKNIELYGNFVDEYGGAELLALNEKVERFNFHYELDGGDEVEQDDFDESKYLDSVKKNQDKWLSLIPVSVVEAFPSLGKHPKLMI